VEHNKTYAFNILFMQAQSVFIRDLWPTVQDFVASHRMQPASTLDAFMDDQSHSYKYGRLSHALTSDSFNIWTPRLLVWSGGGSELAISLIYISYPLINPSVHVTTLMSQPQLHRTVSDNTVL
jgi:hypothetical protein